MTLFDLSPKGVGYVGCVIAIIGFGTQGVFVKSPAIRHAGLDPLFVAFVFSLCVGAVGLVVTAAGDTPFWEADGWRAVGYVAMVLAPGQVLLLCACRRIGVGFAVGIVAATATASSFILGLTVCGDDFRPLTQVPGICLMLLATGAIVATKVPAFEDFLDPIPPHLLLEVLHEWNLDAAAGLVPFRGDAHMDALRETAGGASTGQLSAEALQAANDADGAGASMASAFGAGASMASEVQISGSPYRGALAKGVTEDARTSRRTDPGPSRRAWGDAEGGDAGGDHGDGEERGSLALSDGGGFGVGGLEDASAAARAAFAALEACEGQGAQGAWAWDERFEADARNMSSAAMSTTRGSTNKDLNLDPSRPPLPPSPQRPKPPPSSQLGGTAKGRSTLLHESGLGGTLMVSSGGQAGKALAAARLERLARSRRLRRLAREALAAGQAAVSDHESAAAAAARQQGGAQPGDQLRPLSASFASQTGRRGSAGGAMAAPRRGVSLTGSFRASFRSSAGGGGQRLGSMGRLGSFASSAGGGGLGGSIGGIRVGRLAQPGSLVAANDERHRLSTMSRTVTFDGRYGRQASAAAAARRQSTGPPPSNNPGKVGQMQRAAPDGAARTATAAAAAARSSSGTADTSYAQLDDDQRGGGDRGDDDDDDSAGRRLCRLLLCPCAAAAAVVEVVRDALSHPDVDTSGLSMAAAGGLLLGCQGALWQEAVPAGLSLGHRLAAAFCLQVPATALCLLPPLWLFGRPPGSDDSDYGALHTSGYARRGPGFNKWRVALPWCGAGSLCFTGAVAGQVLALRHLPESVAMPLTQLNVAVAAAWGMALFGEVESPVLQKVFAVAVAVDLAGAALLRL